ncbi:MAG: hypothetical protein N4A32_03405 [Marinifilaceae bacterium]|jgi:CRISPR-associated protein Cmr3|nr:hypothetical protein [Marinifilaceae bacterium]
MAKYLVKLKPVDSYFFGQEVKRVLGNKKSYYQHSACFPQQTSLLGVLRFYLLKINNLIPITPKNRKKVKELIGANSFILKESNGNENDTLQSFGKIERISPLFILKSDDLEKPLFHFDKRYVKGKDDNSSFLTYIESPKAKEGKMHGLGFKDKPIYLLKYDSKNYIAKIGFENFLMSIDEKKTSKFSDVFKSVEKLGIRIDNNYSIDTENINNSQEENPQIENDREKGFFKMEYQILDKEYEFGFVADINTGIEPKDDYVFMGKEKSMFKISLEKLEEGNNMEKYLHKDISTLKTNEPSDTIYKVTFLSDTFIENEQKFNEVSLFYNLETVHFRNLTYYINMDEDYSSKPKKSKGYNLIKKGSEVYTKDINKLKEIIAEGKGNQFLQIGYNHILIEKNNNNE